MNQNKKISPWAWIPTLYFAQGLPYVAVMTISVIMYKRLGISNTDIALYTSWLYLPWVIKPFWSPFVDLFKTKRWWIVVMQLIVGCGLAGIAFTLPTSVFFQLTLAIFWVIGFASATHDIAADGFYMLALDTHSQSKYVGIRSTFYRCATIFGQGILVIIAGLLEMGTGLDPVQVRVRAVPDYANELTWAPSAAAVAVPATGAANMFLLGSDELTLGTQPLPAAEAARWKEEVKARNIANGFAEAEMPAADAAAAETSGWWTERISEPFGNWIRRNFGEEREAAVSADGKAGALAMTTVRLARQPEPGETVVLNLSIDKGDKSLSVAGGERLVFTEQNWNKDAYVLFQADPKLAEASEATFRGLSGNIPVAWSVTFFILAAFFLAITLYHRIILPRPVSDRPVTGEGAVTASTIVREFFGTFASFFRKKQIGVALLFMLLYRFPEAQLVKLINPFLLDGKDVGGMGLTTGEVGIVYGTVGIIGLTLGGIIGGLAAARGGLKKWLWPMAWSISLTCATFLYLSIAQPESLFTINLCVFIEQFGYGFGFTAYMLYLIYFSEGEHKTSHYAICTAFMALGMMIPGMFAGWLQEQLGYTNFFWWVMICCAATILVTALIKVDPNYGKKAEENA